MTNSTHTVEETVARPVINGWTVPERIWLMDIGCGDVTWCDDPNPDGEQVDSVEYVLASHSTPAGEDEVARLVSELRNNGWTASSTGEESDAPYRAADILASLPPLEALERVVHAIDDWARPTGANGMVPAGADHPLCIAALEARAALTKMGEKL